MLADVIGCLACPVCGDELAERERALVCGNGHAHDIAREGYVNLLAGRRVPGTADTPDMVRAREEFLASRRYAPIADAVADALRAHLAASDPGAILEVGAGTGYYLAASLNALPERAGIALDISKHAAKRAARAHARMGSVVADAWGALPIRDACCAAVIDVFAPRNTGEFARVLARAGVLVVVTPTDRHLAELIGPLGLIGIEHNKRERLAEQLSPAFTPVDERVVEAPLELDGDAARTLVAMGPSARHVTADELETRLSRLPDPASATLSVRVSTFRVAQRG